MRTRHLKWIPVVTSGLCDGCNLCVEGCETQSIELRDGVAMMVWRDRCRSDGHCVTLCPENAIRMDWEESSGDHTRGRWAYGGRVWPGRLRGG